ncbi:TonB-dependent receptor [Marinilongibacter aquaticus]|uniref:TonB-dependent receptor n=1 Tax=Marinilongibacter aquaticus TaxID=2975157 RepID=UPI0021BD5AEF|nr:TonB-dependent receptor [Marinilongibacter aquaticus]UBM59670.1 TonB-dependent receptor [Marinilongibacter aquaticus]
MPVTFVNGQNCVLRIQGQVIDEATNAPLPFASLFLENGQKGTMADENGHFEFKDVCPGNTHIRASHLSCEPLQFYLEIKKDTSFTVRMHHHEELMNEVKVHGKYEDQSLENSGTVDQDLIQNKSNQNLADIIQEITGVSVLRTGAGVSKPIVHGMSGNRVAMLNNGVAQAGQQWGNDHAPEIDAFSANHISVLKGVSALQYSGSSLGAVILVEPGHIGDDPHLHGKANYIYQTNGRGHTLNLALEKGGENWAWRLTGTGKKIGDRSSPNYFLNNTGNQEVDASLLVELDKTKLWPKQVYFSTFNSEIGILRGSHIGNLTDLEQSFTRDVPFFTEDKFSYGIDSPKQRVNHQLLKVSTQHRFSRERKLELQYAAQLDHRREYDVRRGVRSDVPALSLNQSNHQFDLKFDQELNTLYFLKTGLTSAFTDNTNQPETGILPLIPDYNSLEEAAFGIVQREKGAWLMEVGGRVHWSTMSVAAISRDLPRRIIHDNLQFLANSLSGGVQWKASSKWSFKANLGYTERPPAINELYSFGLHQGVSSIEIGNPDIQKEKSTKFTLSSDFNLNDKLFIQALAYVNGIRDYIFLQPNPEPMLTIRGAFPVFDYMQTDARLVGFDGLLTYEPIAWLRYVGKVSLLRGQDTKQNNPLIYMPPNNFSHTLTFTFSEGKRFQQNQFTVRWDLVNRQKHYLEGQDFIPPPAAYQLLHVALQTTVFTGKKHLHLAISGDNLLNTVYRDYLNRQRYFADELGRNLSFRVSWEF